MKQPKVIFLDAVGTLFGIKGTVGEIYSNIARKAGVNVDSDALNQAFFASFKAANSLAFPNVNPEAIPELELQWWRAIAKTTFAKVGVLTQFSDFNIFFQELYEHFASKTPWFVYPDVLVALNYWQQKGIELGIISNFDSRIYEVLDSLELRNFFSTITISSLTGIAKPGQEIFTQALQKHSCNPEEAWHIGDNLKEDYQGAKAAGLRAILIKRDPYS